MSVAEATKFNPLNPGSAEDRVIIMPCSMAPTDPGALPFMEHGVIIKTLVIPDDIWYVDRAQGERLAARRCGRPIPPPQIDYNASMEFGNVDSLPLLGPLCLALESMVPESKSYRPLAANCYIFARTVFNALELAYVAQWKHLWGVSDRRRHVLETGLVRPLFVMKPGERYTPSQRIALYFNGKLSMTPKMEYEIGRAHV